MTTYSGSGILGAARAPHGEGEVMTDDGTALHGSGDDERALRRRYADLIG
ncbi:hypothetical protein ABZ801_33880 [Actinomadura sp. NPDC047616]